VLRRIKSLAIPPAWTDVWICPFADGHIQATGRDARGRKQYRYHPRFREVRESTKYEHVVSFAEALISGPRCASTWACVGFRARKSLRPSFICLRPLSFA
jgi:DNA topoisomerase IB